MKSIILITLITLCQASLQDRCKVLLKSLGITINQNQDQRAKTISKHLMDAFTDGGELALDKALEESDKSWYKGIDIYLHDNEDEIFEEFRSDQTANYKKSTSVAVVVTEADGYYLVTVFCF